MCCLVPQFLEVPDLMEYKIKDIKLSDKGRKQLAWAEAHMPALLYIKGELSGRKPLSRLTVSAMLHVTKETGVLMRAIKAAGAEVYLAASNPLSTQDDIAAALASDGIHVFAWRGQSDADYYKNIRIVLQKRPQIIMDDGADLHAAAHKMGLIPLGGTEETTTGVTRLRALEAEGSLKYPVIAVNDAKTKYLFDNRYGTGQSTIDGIIRATNILVAGKCAVVIGYGWVGRGIAMRLDGFGARVIVVEVDPFRALEAVMDGYEVMGIDEAAKFGDLFVTATGNKNVLPSKVFSKLKDGAILANSGHFNVEIDVASLEKIARAKREIRSNLVEYALAGGKKLYLLAEGRLVNLAAAEGHPSEVMDLSFANQALSVVYLKEKHRSLENRVYPVPDETDEYVARLKLKTMGIGIGAMTTEQKRYMSQWEDGT